MAPALPIRIDSSADLVLLLLLASARAGSPSLSGMTRLQKLIFLATQDEEYQRLVAAHGAPKVTYEAYKMGPFTPELYEAVQTLATFRRPLIFATPARRAGADEVENVHYVQELDLDDSEPTWPSGPVMPSEYRLTEDGKLVAERLWAAAPPSLTALMQRLVKQYGRMPLHDLLSFVYREFPDWTWRSEIKQELGLP